MSNKEFQTSNPGFLAIIKKIYPEGVKYANDVISQAVRLDKISKSFYNGSVIQDYGIYPFLDFESACYCNGDSHSDHIIFSSHFDRESFGDFVRSLNIPGFQKKDILNDVDRCYMESSDLLDLSYLTVIRHLVECLKCLEDRRFVRNVFAEALLDLPVGSLRVITANSIITRKYLCKRIRRYNELHSSSTGKFFKVVKCLNAEREFVVSCEKYISR